jgi:transcriptional regulator with XRE-family HTH domain
MSVEARFVKEAEAFGKRITSMRKATSKNQEQVARSVGLTQSQWSLIERGKANFTFYSLVKIAYALEVNSSVLFDYNGEIKYRKQVQVKSIDDRFEIERYKFGSRILDLIQFRKTNQDDFAVKSEMDAGDLSHFINGEHNIELFNMVKIAEGLKVKLLDLYLYKGPLPII